MQGDWNIIIQTLEFSFFYFSQQIFQVKFLELFQTALKKLLRFTNLQQGLTLCIQQLNSISMNLRRKENARSSSEGSQEKQQEEHQKSKRILKKVKSSARIKTEELKPEQPKPTPQNHQRYDLRPTTLHSGLRHKKVRNPREAPKVEVALQLKKTAISIQSRPPPPREESQIDQEHMAGEDVYLSPENYQIARVSQSRVEREVQECISIGSQNSFFIQPYDDQSGGIHSEDSQRNVGKGTSHDRE